MEIFVGIGRSRVFRYDELTFSSMSVRLNLPFESVVNHVEGSEAYVGGSSDFVGVVNVAPTPMRFAAGHVLDLTFPPETDMDAVQIVYGDAKTYIEVDSDLPKVGARSDPAYVVLSGGGPSYALRVFAGSAAVLQVTLPFTDGVTLADGMVDAAAEYTTGGGVVVNSYKSVVNNMIGWGVVAPPLALPVATVFGTLSFTPAVANVSSAVDGASPRLMVEGDGFATLNTLVIDVGDLFDAADPCAACTHYERAAAASGALEHLELAEAGYACVEGDPQLKYAAKQGTTKAQLDKPRMQINAEDPAPLAVHVGRWDYQVECIEPERFRRVARHHLAPTACNAQRTTFTRRRPSATPSTRQRAGCRESFGARTTRKLATSRPTPMRR